jgi:hypothetical protein
MANEEAIGAADAQDLPRVREITPGICSACSRRTS